MVFWSELQQIYQNCGIHSGHGELLYGCGLWELEVTRYGIHPESVYWGSALDGNPLFYVDDESVRFCRRYFIPMRGLLQVLQYELSRVRGDIAELRRVAQTVISFISDNRVDDAYHDAQTMRFDELQPLHTSLPAPTRSWGLESEAIRAIWGDDGLQSVDQRRYAADQVWTTQHQSLRGYRPLQSSKDQEFSGMEVDEMEMDQIEADWIREPQSLDAWEPQFSEHGEPEFLGGTWLLSEVEERIITTVKPAYPNDDDEWQLWEYVSEGPTLAYLEEQRPQSAPY
ncbi:MAG: hypothetical protein Q9200_007541 [Gallowayella weberi]